MEQWLAARADFEIAGLGITEIAKKYGLSKSAVSMRAKADGWQAGKTEQLAIDKANSIIMLAETEQQAERQLNKTEQIVFDRVVADEVAFRLRSDTRMQQVEDKAMELLPLVERASDVKTIMETLRINREARLGKAPDTAIQINNDTSPAKIERIIIDGNTQN